MKYPIINKADGDTSGYAFNTLWQEATNAVGHIASSIVNSLQITERTKQIQAYIDLKKDEIRNQWSIDIINNTKGKSNTGYYIVMILMLAILCGGLVFATKYSNKK